MVAGPLHLPGGDVEAKVLGLVSVVFSLEVTVDTLSTGEEGWPKA